MSQKRLVIAGACRTPVGRFGQRLKNVSPQELLRVCFKDTLRRTNIHPLNVDSAVAGTCIHTHDAMNVARVSLLLAGLSDEELSNYRQKGQGIPMDVIRKSSFLDKPAFTASRNCGSGLQAVVSAAQEIKDDFNDSQVVLAGGTESMSNSPYILARNGCGYHIRDSVLVDSLLHGLRDPLTGDLMGLSAENSVEKHGITREDQDKFAVRSHQRAFKAIRSGKFKSQIAPVTIYEKNILGEMSEETIHEDEGPNPGLTPGKLAALKPYFKKGGTITAGNSCSINDGAASFLVMTLERAQKLGVQPEAEIISYGVAALHPSYMGEGPACVVPNLLRKAGLTIKDIDVFENNEAFAATSLAVQRLLGISDEVLNINGGAIALGHPVGASGAILTVKAIYLLQELQKTYAMISLCIGNGQGIAMLIRRFV